MWTVPTSLNEFKAQFQQNARLLLENVHADRARVCGLENQTNNRLLVSQAQALALAEELRDVRTELLNAHSREQGQDEAIANLNRTLDLLQSPVQAVSDSGNACVADPESFDGSKCQALPGFFKGLALKFRVNSSSFPSDLVKITYAGALLEGPAREWFLSYVTEAGIPIFASYAAFVSDMTLIFGDPDPVATAEHQLNLLEQGRNSVAVFYLEFQQLMAVLGWNENAQRWWFQCRLNDQIRQVLVSVDTPTNLKEFVQLCIRLESRIRALDEERANEGRREETLLPAPSAHPPWLL